MFLPPSIPSSQRGQAVKFLIFPVCTVLNIPVGFGCERPGRYDQCKKVPSALRLLAYMIRDGIIALQPGKGILQL